MAQQQQTVLRVQTNIPSGIEYSGDTGLLITYKDGFIISGGLGTLSSPYTGSTTGSTSTNDWSIDFKVTGGTGVFYYDINNISYPGSSYDLYQYYSTRFTIEHFNGIQGMGGFKEYKTNSLTGTFTVQDNDNIRITSAIIPTGSTFSFYVIPNIEVNNSEVITYDTLDLYDDIPIKLNKSFAEIQDISKRNSDYSIGLLLPGSKKNNKFFENFYNVDVDTLYFDVTKRVNIDILLDDEQYFTGYMRLNKVSVQNSQIEYDVTLYSTVADLYGKIGNNLLKDLDYNDPDYHFNHYFNMWNVASTWAYNPLQSRDIAPSLWLYPVIHNGYEYSGETVNLSGSTVSGQTRLYTTTTAATFTNYSNFTSSGGQEFRINSPINPILDNQLKPAINIYCLLQLLFKSYGYKIKSKFMETPWFKLLYLYGYYSYDGTKFGYKTPVPQTLTLEGVNVLLVESIVSQIIETPCGFPGYIKTTRKYDIYVVKAGTGIPCLCSQQIDIGLDFGLFPCSGGFSPQTVPLSIPPNTTGTSYQWISDQYVDCGSGCPFQFELKQNYGFNASVSNVGLSTQPLAYPPSIPNTNILFTENDYVDFSLVIDTDIKQIDILSSIAKKFDLIIYPNPDVPNEFIIEPYDYYIGTGIIYDWTDKLSWDKGFSVEPAQNFIESELILTDLEDGDEANKTFKDRNKLIYGENRVYNPTDFKSQTKKIETTFSPQVIRKWDNNVGIPLGINYAGQSTNKTDGGTERVIWKYTGLKSKPRLMFYNGNFSPFLDQVGERYIFTGSSVNTIFFRLQPSDAVNPFSNTYAFGTFVNPVISHTLPMGNPDSNKINNDSICILFNSQQPDDIGLGIPTFNAYTDNDTYQLFYSNRMNNIYDKNTRFLEGNFNLKISDVKNLKPNDIIKIQEQYFIINKINNFDVTNPELTKVELIQTNVTPKKYPNRYFKYKYCNETGSTIYKFQTFFDPTENVGGSTFGDEKSNSFRRTYFYWSIFYDYMVGALGGSVSGITTSYNIPSSGFVWAVTINEISESEYDSSSYNFWYQDPNNDYFIDREYLSPNLIANESSQLVYVFSNSGSTSGDYAFFNVASNCSNFTGYCLTNFVTIQPPPTTGSTPGSIYHSGITLNVTDTGWIKYDTSSGTIYQNITSLGNYDIPDCADCLSVRVGIPFADLAAFTISDCGNSC